MTQVLARKDLLSWLRKLMEGRSLIAPRRDGELTTFAPVNGVDEIAFDFDNSTISPKDYFFPRTETLFTVDRKNGGAEITPAVVERETVVFGVRPCDARALSLLDLPFLGQPADSMWAQHRQKTYLIGLACSKPKVSCFCTSMGSGPHDASNVDIMLTEVEGGYAVDALTGKGKLLLQGAEVKETNVAVPEAPKCPTNVPAEGIEQALRKAFDSPYWGRVADRCIHCNICAYVCPTCYCFDVRDHSRGNTVDRVRTWESCQAKGFSRIAGGYDPRADKGKRLRQRFAHKLLYFPPDFGPIACTGCGRCVTLCPVNIDIREIITDVQKAGTKVDQPKA